MANPLDDVFSDTQDQDFSELDALLLPSPELDANAGDEFDLDKLLKDSVRMRSEEESIKQSRKLLSQRGIDAETRKNLQDTLRQWEVKREWTPSALVAMFSLQQCISCFSNSPQFSGYYQRQVHRLSKIERWVQSTPSACTKLPREVKYETSHVDICHDCASEHQFSTGTI